MIKKSYQDRTQVIEIFVSRPLEELDDSKKKSIGIQPSLAMYQWELKSEEKHLTVFLSARPSLISRLFTTRYKGLSNPG